MNQKLLDKVKEAIGDRKGAHGLDHFIRVRTTALKIAEMEEADKEIVEAMALLHDIVRYEDEREEKSVEETLKMAKEILTNLNYSEEKIIAILDGISSHSLHSQLKKDPSTIEAKILFDADKIDSVGEIGIARWFMTMKNRNISVKETASIYLNTIEKQERKMGGKMYTALGDKMVRDRIKFTKQFLNHLLKRIE